MMYLPHRSLCIYGSQGWGGHWSALSSMMYLPHWSLCIYGSQEWGGHWSALSSMMYLPHHSLCIYGSQEWGGHWSALSPIMYQCVCHHQPTCTVFVVTKNAIVFHFLYIITYDNQELNECIHIMHPYFVVLQSGKQLSEQSYNDFECLLILCWSV